MGTYRKRRKVHDKVPKYRGQHEANHPHLQRHANLGTGEYFQRIYRDQNQQTKGTDHPLFNLPIPTPTVQEAQFLNDEVDMYVVRTNALQKFKMSNDLLDNILLKAIPAQKISPPTAFPVCTIDGVVYSEKKPDEPEGWLAERVKASGPGTFIVGNLEAMREKERQQKALLEELEAPDEGKDDTAAAVVSEEYLVTTAALDELKALYSKYTRETAAEFDEKVKVYDEKLKALGKRVVEEPLFEQKSLKDNGKDLFGPSECITYKEYKEHAEAERLRVEEWERKKIQELEELQRRQKAEQEEARRKKEEEERRAKEAAEEAARKKKEAEEAAQKKREQEANEEEERKKKQKEEEEKEKEAAAAAAATAAAIDEIEKQQQEEVGGHDGAGASVSVSVGADAAVDDKTVDPSLNDLFGSGSNGNFDFDNNLLYDGGDDDNLGQDSSAFDELDNQVWDNLE